MSELIDDYYTVINHYREMVNSRINELRQNPAVVEYERLRNNLDIADVMNARACELDKKRDVIDVKNAPTAEERRDEVIRDVDVDTVASWRDMGLSWWTVGEKLGVSGTTAWKRYKSVVDKLNANKGSDKNVPIVTHARLEQPKMLGKMVESASYTSSAVSKYENPLKEMSKLFEFTSSDVAKILRGYYPRNLRITLRSYAHSYITHMSERKLIERHNCSSGRHGVALWIKTDRVKPSGDSTKPQLYDKEKFIEERNHEREH